MKITIGYLFYDLLNLYGESGNVLALDFALKKQGIDTEIKYLSIYDDIDFSLLDFIYIGCGTENNQKIVLDFLKKYKEDILQYVMNNNFILATGNSIELFGKHIKLLDGTTKECLETFSYYTERTEKRLVSECIFKHDDFDEKILGFENDCGITMDNTSPLFTIIKGYGEVKDYGVEGFVKNNFYGTYLLGPILARNPKFLEYIVKKLVTSIDESFEFKPFELEFSTIAHDKFLEKYNK